MDEDIPVLYLSVNQRTNLVPLLDLCSTSCLQGQAANELQPSTISSCNCFEMRSSISMARLQMFGLTNPECDRILLPPLHCTFVGPARLPPSPPMALDTCPQILPRIFSVKFLYSLKHQAGRQS